MKAFAMFLFLFIIGGCSSSHNTQNAVSQSVEKLISDKSFRFIPDFLYPMSGQRRYVNDGSYLEITKDKLVSDLPFFGQAYTAGYNEPGGIKFSSTDFVYDQIFNKDGNIEITIDPKDSPGVSKIYLTVFKNGSGNLKIISNNRSPISYDGNIKTIDTANKN